MVFVTVAYNYRDKSSNRSIWSCKQRVQVCCRTVWTNNLGIALGWSKYHF